MSKVSFLGIVYQSKDHAQELSSNDSDGSE